jgi:glutathione synthase
MLEKLPATTLIVNNPKAIRDLPEKLFICGFPSLTPPTLVTKNIDVAREFRNQHLNIVVKPIYSYSGNDVFVVKEGDENFDVIIASLIKTYNQPLIFQKFIPEVKNGEKRIFLIDGKAVAAILKIPAKDQIRANLVAGSRVYSYKLSNQDLLICDQLGAELKKRGVIFAGIDMIGGYITEINITSPTLIGYANKLDNISIESMIWDKIEEKIL